MRTTLFLFFVWVSTISLKGQTAPFDIFLQPITIAGLPGLQSYAFGQHNGKWLLVGGRLDGLHLRQPGSSFSQSGNNTNLLVVDPVSLQKWNASITTLPVSIREQLSSTNMQFYQQDSMLYCIGGYGYSSSAGDHITYPNLTAINVPRVIDAIVNGLAFNSYFRQLNDAQFAVTGGRLDKIYGNYYLVGGQKFTGRYNPMGPTHGPGFIQEYTNAIRKFTIIDNGVTLAITHQIGFYDSINLHRRDYNVAPQIFPNGKAGLTAFSGVFQPTANVPYLSAVNIDSSGYSVDGAFAQYYNHYHCANIALYSENKNEMHTLFFGGIAQYYDSAGILIQNNEVPFVKTIARVSRDSNGTMSEHKLPIEMPNYLGSGSEFIPTSEIAEYTNHVIALDSLENDTNFIGCIYGGISSTAANIFFTNTGTQSNASNQLFKVFIIQNSNLAHHELNKQSANTLQMQVYPNPNEGQFNISYTLSAQSDVKISIANGLGEIIEITKLKNVHKGVNQFQNSFSNLKNGGMYFITVESRELKSTQKIILK